MTDPLDRASIALAVQLLCALGPAAGYWLAQQFHSSSVFVAEPVPVFRIFLAIELPLVIVLYSLVRSDRGRTPFLKAVGRGILGLPAGAVINAFGAIVLGAPVGIGYLTKTMYWSLLMSLFSFVPACCVYGSSWKDWQRILALSKLSGALDCMVSFPGHGAIIGAWFGAWPMPLDWERPWQEWPICVTYGAAFGYMLGLLASSLFILGKKTHEKGD